MDRNLLDDSKSVRITWVDLCNIVRYRIVPIKYFRKLVENKDRHKDAFEYDGEKQEGAVLYNTRPGITLTKASLGLFDLTLADGFSAVGEYVYTPDLESARYIEFAGGNHTIVFGRFEEKQIEGSGKLVRTRDTDLFRVPLCPRSILQRVVDHAFQTESVSFLVGFETEVIFLSSTDPIKAVNDYGWSESRAILSDAPEQKALEKIAFWLDKADIELQMYHAEAAPGQFEFVTGPLPPLEACDALITTREIILNAAALYGLHATFAPRVYSNSCGSAAHAHISLESTLKFWSSSKPQSVRVSATPSVTLTPLQQSFLSGLLEHLPAATAFTLPTRASYARMVDGIWSGGTWVSWGRDNREAPVRLAGRSPTDAGYNFEVKSVDGTANPYLAISALLSAGMLGVESRQPLETVGLQVPASSLSEKEREEYRVVDRMPLSIDEARKALIEDEELKGALGDEFVTTYLSVNKTLNEQLMAPTPEEELLKLIKTY